MGKTKQRKRKRRGAVGGAFGNPPTRLPAGVVTHSFGKVPKIVFRYFREKHEADMLLDGVVWLSTLEACRGHEQPERGDSGEGSLEYGSGVVSGDGNNPALQTVARHLGFKVAPGARDISIVDCTADYSINDGFVLCTTLDDQPEEMAAFGLHCVAIHNPKSFCKRGTEQLHVRRALHLVELGPVTYGKRSHAFLEPAPGRPGFVKPTTYSSQQEYRMLWHPIDTNGLAPFALGVDGVRDLVQRVR